MGFLDRFQGNKVDPMAEVSANAVAHLRERNLKFQRFMLDKVQDLEEKAAMGQQRLSEPDADAGDFGDSDFTDHGLDTRVQPAGEDDMRISLEAGVLLTAEQAAGDPDNLPVIETAAAASAAGAPERISVEPENIPEPAPAETLPESEQAPVEEEAGSPNWEDIFGIGATTPIAAEAAVDDAVAAEAASEVEFETLEPALNEVEPASEVQQPATEAAESEATGPAKTAAETAIEAVKTENVPTAKTVPQEVVFPQDSSAAQEPRSGGGSLMWDWRSLSAQNVDAGFEQTSTGIDPIWEPEVAGQSADGSVDGTVDEEGPDEDTESSDTGDETEVKPDPAGDIQALPAVDMDEDAQELDEEFMLLGDAQEQEDMVDIPLPDELGDFS